MGMPIIIEEEIDGIYVLIRRQILLIQLHTVRIALGLTLSPYSIDYYYYYYWRE